MTAPVTQLEYRQLIEDCLDDLADHIDAGRITATQLRDFIRHWYEQVGAL